MIGQRNILDEIDILSMSPLILVGPRGSGKKTLIKELAHICGIDNIIYIDKTLTDITKMSMHSIVTNTIVVFDFTKPMQQKQFVSFENSLLKILEDTPMYCRFILLVENEYVLLDTILNRCRVQYIQPYSIEDLFDIADICGNYNIKDYSSDQLRYINYPNDVITAPTCEELDKIETLIDTILSSIYNANISNILSITKKLKFNEEGNGYDIDLFMNIFNHKLVGMVVNNSDRKYIDMHNMFSKLLYMCSSPSSNKKNLLEEFLLSIKYM